MRTESIRKTGAIASILVALQERNYAIASQESLAYLGLQRLGAALTKQHLQWLPVWTALKPHLAEDATCLRVLAIVDALPGTVSEIAQATGFKETTVSVTLNALISGGCPLIITAELRGDRAVRVYSVDETLRSSSKIALSMFGAIDADATSAACGTA